MMLELRYHFFQQPVISNTMKQGDVAVFDSALIRPFRFLDFGKILWSVRTQDCHRIGGVVRRCSEIIGLCLRRSTRSRLAGSISTGTRCVT